MLSKTSESQCGKLHVFEIVISKTSKSKICGKKPTSPHYFCAVSTKVPSVTTNIILQTLEIINHRFGLPPVLNLQLDNCWRENKNKYVFALLSLLVELSVFHKVQFLHLVVVHIKLKAKNLFSTYYYQKDCSVLGFLD